MRWRRAIVHHALLRRTNRVCVVACLEVFIPNLWTIIKKIITMKNTSDVSEYYRPRAAVKMKHTKMLSSTLKVDTSVIGE